MQSTRVLINTTITPTSTTMTLTTNSHAAIITITPNTIILVDSIAAAGTIITTTTVSTIITNTTTSTSTNINNIDVATHTINQKQVFYQVMVLSCIIILAIISQVTDQKRLLHVNHLFVTDSNTGRVRIIGTSDDNLGCGT
jgi:hypothetical protein